MEVNRDYEDNLHTHYQHRPFHSFGAYWVTAILYTDFKLGPWSLY
jgi:hypothetical protein